MTYEVDAVDAAILAHRLAAASVALLKAGAVLREVLDGAGASLEEKLRASVALMSVQAELGPRAPTLPKTPEQIEREYVERPAGKIINLGMRRKP